MQLKANGAVVAERVSAPYVAVNGRAVCVMLAPHAMPAMFSVADEMLRPGV